MRLHQLLLLTTLHLLVTQLRGQSDCWTPDVGLFFNENKQAQRELVDQSSCINWCRATEGCLAAVTSPRWFAFRECFLTNATDIGPRSSWDTALKSCFDDADAELQDIAIVGAELQDIAIVGAELQDIAIVGAEANSWYQNDIDPTRYQPSNARDGVYSTFYSVKDGDTLGNFLKLYLPQRYRIDRVDVTNRLDHCCHDRITGTTVKVYIADLGEVATCGTITDYNKENLKDKDAQTYTLYCDGVVGDMIYITDTVIEGHNWPNGAVGHGISEVQVFGSPASSETTPAQSSTTTVTLAADPTLTAPETYETVTPANPEPAEEVITGPAEEPAQPTEESPSESDDIKAKEKQQKKKGEKKKKGKNKKKGEKKKKGEGKKNKEKKKKQVGEKGEPGLPGVNGDDGIPGDDGTYGSNGYCDAAACTGGVGEEGDVGGPGVGGPNGPYGDSGADGERGDQGYKGYPGSDGRKGALGEPGRDGADGVPGCDRGGCGTLRLGRCYAKSSIRLSVQCKVGYAAASIWRNTRFFGIKCCQVLGTSQV